MSRSQPWTLQNSWISARRKAFMSGWKSWFWMKVYLPVTLAFDLGRAMAAMTVGVGAGVAVAAGAPEAAGAAAGFVAVVPAADAAGAAEGTGAAVGVGSAPQAARIGSAANPAPIRPMRRRNC